MNTHDEHSNFSPELGQNHADYLTAVSDISEEFKTENISMCTMALTRDPNNDEEHVFGVLFNGSARDLSQMLINLCHQDRMIETVVINVCTKLMRDKIERDF